MDTFEENVFPALLRQGGEFNFSLGQCSKMRMAADCKQSLLYEADNKK